MMEKKKQRLAMNKESRKAYDDYKTAHEKLNDTIRARRHEYEEETAGKFVRKCDIDKWNT